MNASPQKTEELTQDRPLSDDEKRRAVFAVGELIPLKGKWFRVDSISLKTVILSPVGETGKRKKGRA